MPDVHKYVELRTLLDSLEIGALRYYLNAYGPDEEKERFNYLRDQLKPIADYVWAAARAAAVAPGTCPEGYVECYGCCVPYPCVG